MHQAGFHFRASISEQSILTFCQEGGYRFVAPWTGGVGITPYAAGQFKTFDLPSYAEQALSGASTFALAYGAKDVTEPQ